MAEAKLKEAKTEAKLEAEFAEAEAQAETQGCKGAHAMGDFWMPCSEHPASN